MNYFVTGGNGATSVVDTNVTDSTVLTNLSIYTTYTIFVRARTVVFGNSTLVDVSTDEGSEFLVILLYSVYQVEYVVFVDNTHGRLSNFVFDMNLVPSSPKNVTAVENGTVVTVSWQPPDVKNGPSVTYVITYYGFKNVCGDMMQAHTWHIARLYNTT